MMSVLDLNLDETTLALDLIAQWQLDKIQEQPSSTNWLDQRTVGSIEEGSPVFDQETGLANWKGFFFSRNSSKDIWTAEVDMRPDGFYLLVWARPSTPHALPTLRQLTESGAYKQEGCVWDDMKCVRSRLCRMKMLRLNFSCI